MSVSTVESKLRSLQSELQRLSRSLEQEEKRELSYLNSKTRTEKSITKNTSASTLKSKMRTISGYQDKVKAKNGLRLQKNKPSYKKSKTRFSLK